MTSLSDRAGFLVVANLIKYAVGFVMPMVLVRFLTKDDYGSYQQMLLIGTTALGLMTIGLPTSVYYFYHHVGKEKIPALIAQTTIMLVVSGLFATLFIFFGADHFAKQMNNPSMTGLLQIYALSIVLTVGSEHCLHFMISQNRYGLAVMFEIIETFVRVLTLLAPLWLGFGFTGLIVGVVAYAAMRFVARNAYLFGRSGLDFKGWRQQAFPRQQLEYSTPIALVGLAGLVGNAFNRGILATTFTPSQYATYAVGALEIPLDVIFQASVANVLRASLPPLVRDGNLDEVVRILREAVRKLSIIVMPSFIFLMGYSYDFIVLLFTSTYHDSVPIFRIYLCMMPLYMLVLSTVPHVFGKPKLNLYITLWGTALLLILSYVFLKTIGLYGPAMALVVSQYVQTVAFFVIVIRLTKSTFVKLMPIRHIAMVCVAGGAGLLASTLVNHLTGVGLLNLFLAGVVFSITFFIAAVPLRIFTGEDIRLMRRWAAKVLPIKPA